MLHRKVPWNYVQMVLEGSITGSNFFAMDVRWQLHFRRLVFLSSQNFLCANLVVRLVCERTNQIAREAPVDGLVCSYGMDLFGTEFLIKV